MLILYTGVDLLSDATCVVADGGLDINVKGTVSQPHFYSFANSTSSHRMCLGARKSDV